MQVSQDVAHSRDKEKECQERKGDHKNIEQQQNSKKEVQKNA